MPRPYRSVESGSASPYLRRLHRPGERPVDRPTNRSTFVCDVNAKSNPRGAIDVGLQHLAQIPWLADIDIQNTGATETGVRQLAKALPECIIRWVGGNIEP